MCWEIQNPSCTLWNQYRYSQILITKRNVYSHTPILIFFYYLIGWTSLLFLHYSFSHIILLLNKKNTTDISSILRAIGRHNKLDLNHRRQPRSRSRMHDDAQRGDKRDAVQNLCCISTIFTHTEFGCVCVCVCMVECVCMCVHKRKHIPEREKERGRVSEWVSERARERGGESDRERMRAGKRERERGRERVTIVYSLSVSSWQITYTVNSQINRDFRYFIGFWKVMVRESWTHGLMGYLWGFCGVFYNFCV